MKVFLSWSGDLSKSIAMELREWLPQVIQGIKPWLSSKDIAKGSRWAHELARELRDSRAAVFCVTPQNQAEPWLNFEAGAVSNQATINAESDWATRVCTYLFDMKPSDITGPIAQFQHTFCDRDDTFSLIKTLNEAQGDEALEGRILQKSFDTYWPELESALDRIRNSMPQPKAIKRTTEDIVEEILNIVRGLQLSAESSPYAYIGDYPRLENFNRLLALNELMSEPQSGATKTSNEMAPGLSLKAPASDRAIAKPRPTTGRLYSRPMVQPKFKSRPATPSNKPTGE